MIPKIIHYCWFGGNPLPERDQKCIESWTKYCPNYKIMLWDESNYDVTKNKYMHQAYQEKKWGFVPDFARLDIIYNYGGIYLDTDVEIVRNLDELLREKAFMGFEDHKFINPGLGFGAEPKHSGIGELLKIYDFRLFRLGDGTLDTTPSPQLNTEMLVAHGAVMNDQKQNIMGITLYPTEYFCPKSYETGKLVLTDNTFSIHHFNASWKSDLSKDILQMKWKLNEKYRSRLLIKVMSVVSIYRKYYRKKFMLELMKAVLIRVKKSRK